MLGKSRNDDSLAILYNQGCISLLFIDIRIPLDVTRIVNLVFFDVDIHLHVFPVDNMRCNLQPQDNILELDFPVAVLID